MHSRQKGPKWINVHFTHAAVQAIETAMQAYISTEPVEELRQAGSRLPLHEKACVVAALAQTHVRKCLTAQPTAGTHDNIASKDSRGHGSREAARRSRPRAAAGGRS